MIQPKLPKGTNDWVGKEVVLREEIFKTLTDAFKRHGGNALDTPVFELKDVLAGKYGEDSRLIYDLQDQGGELCSLRYDLTVPFARWLAMNNDKTQIKRYQVAKVCRRDQPAISKGRFREFYQCDFDIAGVYDKMIPDAETLSIIVEAFKALDLDITIKLNHRKILDGLFAVAGVPEDKTRSISSSIDKLDKMSWADVRTEMIRKGLPDSIADTIGQLVRHHGTTDEILEALKAHQSLATNKDIQAGISDMETLASFMDAFGITKHVSFDLSLARGLDYYTGLIFEVTTTSQCFNYTNENESPEKAKFDNVQVGSIAAGGRYDDLAGMYGSKQIPCVGVSFGVDRIFTILKARMPRSWKNPLHPEIDVYISAVGGGFLLERISVARQLWDAGISAKFAAKTSPTMRREREMFRDAAVVVLLGADELERGCVRVKSTAGAEDAEESGEANEERNRGRVVPRDGLVAVVKALLQR
ncbi:unnamed protein product [Discula destructiva]